MRADRTIVNGGIARLRADIQTGSWYTKHRNLLDLVSLDLGHRIIVVDLIASAKKKTSPAPWP
jgi:hypothetical protein